MTTSLRVVLIKPTKYAPDGTVDRFRRGFMPNATLPYLASLTPDRLGDLHLEVHAVDEYVQTDLEYLRLLESPPGGRTLVAMVGVQSHQFHRALDLAALARSRGAGAIIGGPHPMTCDTTMLQGYGVSFALCEAELVWREILEDAGRGVLDAVYGRGRRWEQRLDPPVLRPPAQLDFARYAMPILGVYPARGCPYSCNFCSVIKIAGHRIRSQPIETTMASLRAAKAAGVRMIFFTSDNFNKWPQAGELLEAMIAERIELPFWSQCDAQVYRQPELVELMARAGLFQMLVGVESFNPATLRSVHKFHNNVEKYGEIVRLCREHGVTTHFSNIIGFPDDTEEGILEHLQTVRSLEPDMASFYILCPIPGTEQYDNFRRDGWITETNLDRFDASAPTWRHPNLKAEELTRLTFHCYREFNRGRDVMPKLARVKSWPRDFRSSTSLESLAGYSAMSRFAVWQGRHPMAGGISPVRLDRAQDYAELRRRVFGFDLAPLPDSLPLSRAEEEINRAAKLLPTHRMPGPLDAFGRAPAQRSAS